MFKNKTKVLEKRIEYLSEKLEELIKRVEVLETVTVREDEKKKVVWLASTISGFLTQEDFDKFTKICSDIAYKDETFKYEANLDDREVYLYSTEKNALHKKSMWLVNKTGIEGLKYTIE